MKPGLIFKSMIAAACVAGSLPVYADLQARDANSDGTVDAYFDTSLGITWLADFNYANTTGYTDPVSFGLGTSLNLAEARRWADSLTYFGATGWRLPDVSPVNGVSFNYALSNDGTTDNGYGISTNASGFPSTSSELRHLFYVSLGNVGGGDTAEAGQPFNAGGFRNLDRLLGTYWSGQTVNYNEPGGPTLGWDFDFRDGSQDSGTPTNGIRVVAVHNGDVFASAVPEPGTYALMLAGLALIAPIARRRSR